MAVKTLPAFVNGVGAATDTNVVTALPGRKIRVVGGWVSAGAAASTVQFNSKGSGAGTACAGLINLPINGIFGLDGVVIQTNMSEGLTITTVGAGPTAVHVTYETAS
jgi:hypothetical protein